MKKTFLISAAVIIVLGALAASVYLYLHTDVEELSSEVQRLAQLPEGATPELTLLKTIVQYVQQFLPTL